MQQKNFHYIYIICFILFVLVYFFLLKPLRVSALTFNPNGTEITVTDTETLRDYCFYKFRYNASDVEMTALFVSKDIANRYECAIAYSSFDYFYKYDNTKMYGYNNGSSVNFSKYYYNANFEYTTTSTQSYANIYNNQIYFASSPVYSDNNHSSILINSNFTFNDILSKYPTSEGESSVSSPINKEEFYTLLVILSLLIWLLFLRWCFPMSRGKGL